MAISTDFNYADLLSLDKAKLVGNERQNFLGTKELVLDYHGISSSSKADCVEWLETPEPTGGGRLTLLNPTFSFKTYEGTWTCVSITYNEDASIIRQSFKIDSSIGDLGDWDGEPPEPDSGEWAAQSGDVARISDGMLLERAYYWRISNPESVNLPSASITGEIWTKSATDNGDGTYDVTVSKEVAVNLESDNEVSSLGYTEYAEINTNDTQQAFGVDVAYAVVGEIKRIENAPLENGKFRTTVTTRTAIAQRIPATSEGEPGYIAWPSDYSDSGGSFSADGGRLIVGKNQTISNFYADITSLDGRFINTVSSSINDYGLIDYSIRSTI